MFIESTAHKLLLLLYEQDVLGYTSRSYVVLV